jgi:hypothetical protein
MPSISALGQKVKAKYPGQYDDLSDLELGQKVKAKYPTEYADFSDITVKAHTRGRPQRTSPGLGATIGGITGGTAAALSGAGLPARGVLAGAGGALGEAGQQAVEQGAVNTMGGPPLAGVMLDPGMLAQAAGQQSLYQSGGDLAAAGLLRPLKPFTKAVGAKLSQATQAALAAAEGKGVQISATQAAQDALDPFVTRAKALGEKQFQALEEFYQNFVANKGLVTGEGLAGGAQRVMTPTEAHLAMEEFQQLAKPTYKQMITGDALPPAARQWAKSMATRLRQELIQNVPGYGKAMGQAQGNLLAKRAVSLAARPAAAGAAAVALHETPGLNALPSPIKYALAAGAMAAPNNAALTSLASLAFNPVFRALMAGSVANAARAANSGQQQP